MTQPTLLENITSSQDPNARSQTSQKFEVGSLRFKCHQTFCFRLTPKPQPNLYSQSSNFPSFPNFNHNQTVKPSYDLLPTKIEEKNGTTIYTFHMSREILEQYKGGSAELITDLKLDFNENTSSPREDSESMHPLDRTHGLKGLCDGINMTLLTNTPYSCLAESFQFIATEIESKLVQRKSPDKYQNSFIAEFKHWHENTFYSYTSSMKTACPMKIDDLAAHTRKECENSRTQTMSNETLNDTQKNDIIQSIDRVTQNKTLFQINMSTTLLCADEEQLKERIETASQAMNQPRYRSLSLGGMSAADLKPINESTNNGCHATAKEAQHSTRKFNGETMKEALKSNRCIFKLAVEPPPALKQTGIEQLKK